jgi:beta-glucosidase
VTKGFTYMYLKGAPLFPFGHGLSYTRFSYGRLSVGQKEIPSNGQLTVSVDVKNTGQRAGDEVVQLYTHDRQSSVKRPVRELRGFKRIHLNPGEKQTVSFTLKGEKLAFYDDKIHQFRVEPGTFDLMVGSSSADIRSKGTVKVSASK